MSSDQPTSLSDPRHAMFVRLLSAAEGRIYGFILTMVSRPADAEELAQEVSIILWRKFDTFRVGEDFVRWACGIAYYEVLHYLRTTHREKRAFNEAALERLRDYQLDNVDVLNRRQVALDDCLAQLSEKDRGLVEHYYFGGKVTAAEVARALNRSVTAVYKSLERIRLALHHCIDRALAREEGE